MANASAKPNIPTAGPIVTPSAAASTSNVPIIGPVQENDTSTSVNAIKKRLPIPDEESALESIRFVHDDGRVRSNAPKNDMAKTTSSRKKKILKMAFVERLFSALAPKAAVTNNPIAR